MSLPGVALRESTRGDQGPVGASEHESVVERLVAGEAAAWDEFLEAFAPLILQVVRLFEWDEDRVGDCFLFVCEGLCRDSYRRLSRYRASGPASFATWLRAVVRNLCLDWRRARFGRLVTPRSVAELPPFERQGFRLIYQQGLTLDEVLGTLQTLFPKLSSSEVLRGLDRVERRYGSPQLRRRSRERPELVSLSGFAEGREARERSVPDTRPGPEQMTEALEVAEILERAVASLPEDERLLVRLRFEQELTLSEIADLTGLSNPQAADRRLRKVLRKLREPLRLVAERRGGNSV